MTPRAQSLDILIVDDSDEDREAVRAYLRRDGELRYVFHEAATGRQASELLLQRGQRVDCVLLDVHLPDMDGFELIGALVNLHGDLRYPVIMMTGSRCLDAERRAIEAGVQDVLDKAWLAPDLLSSAVAKAVGRFKRTAARHVRVPPAENSAST